MAKKTVLKTIITKDYLSGKLLPGHKMPSIRDMAKLYNTSGATISKVFEILAAEKKLDKKAGSGYYIADNFVSEEKPKIGFIVNCLLEPIGQKVLKGVQYVAQNNNFSLEIADSNFDIDAEYQIIKTMYERGVSGIVLYPNINFPVEPCYLSREFRNLPIVVVDMYKQQMNRPHVIFDNYQAAKELVNYFASKGKKNIAFLKPEHIEQYSSVYDRFRGYMCGLENNDLSFDRQLCPSFDLGLSANKVGVNSLNFAVSSLFGKESHPNAIIAPHDFAALNVVNQLKREYPAISSNIEVAGFDNDHFATRIAMLASNGKIKTWKTTNPNFVTMGERAAELLIDMLLNNKNCSMTEIVLPCPVISFEKDHIMHSSENQQIKVS
jgi:LacI family transcriptional regulator, sucrose operon repressor